MAPDASPLFSVIVPTFDRAHVLARTVTSVLSQDLEDFELLIVDDGSTDGTVEVVEALDDPRIRLLRQAHSGVSSARNLGLSRARGRAVTFLDSDDVAFPDWLSAFAALLENPEIGIATGGALAIHYARDGTELTRDLLLPRPLGPLYGHQSLRYTAGALAVRRDLLVSIGGYAERLEFAENAEMAMRLVPACLKRGLRIGRVDRPLVTYHRTPSSWTTRREAFERIRAGTEYILERHGDAIRTLSPAVYANYRGVAAVNAARLGDVRVARRYLLDAIRAYPRRWQSYLRLVLTSMPRLAVRYWTRHGTDPADLGDPM